MKYLVEFNNGFENDENDLTNCFETLEEAKKYAKNNCDVYYTICKGDYIFEDGIYQGSGEAIYSNCDEPSNTWFYARSANIKTVEEL